MPGTDRQPSSLRCLSALFQTMVGLISTSGWSRSSEMSITIRRSCTSTWVAARPMPLASYMVSQHVGHQRADTLRRPLAPVWPPCAVWGRDNKEWVTKPWILFKDVAIFANFTPVGISARQKTLPNQGLERKIVRDLSRFSRRHHTIVVKPRKPSEAPTMQQAMTQKLSIKSKVALALVTSAAAGWLHSPAFAQNYPITSDQRATANQVAQAGVPLSELAANAPDSYLIKSGDTLWAHLRHVPEEPMALAGTVGHEPLGNPQSAPDLSGPASGARAQGRPRHLAHGRRQRHGPGANRNHQGVAPHALRSAGQRPAAGPQSPAPSNPSWPSRSWSTRPG